MGFLEGGNWGFQEFCFSLGFFLGNKSHWEQWDGGFGIWGGLGFSSQGLRGFGISLPEQRDLGFPSQSGEIWDFSPKICGNLGFLFPSWESFGISPPKVGGFLGFPLPNLGQFRPSHFTPTPNENQQLHFIYYKTIKNITQFPQFPPIP